MTDDKAKKQDKTTAEDKKASAGTLSIGSGTLGAKSGATLSVGGGAGGASRSGSRGGSNVAVEVRKRRDFSAQSATQQPVDPALTEKVRLLEEAQRREAEETKRREEEKRVAEELNRERAAEIERKRQDEEARRRKAEEASRAVEAAAPAATPEVASPQAIPATAEEVAEAERRAQAKRKEAQAQEGDAERRFKDTRNDAVPGRPQEKDYSRKRGRNAYLEDLEQRYRSSRRKNARKNVSANVQQQEKRVREVIIPEAITVSELANRMSERAADVVKRFMMMGQMVTQNQILDQETAALVVEEFGHSFKLVSEADVEDVLQNEVDKPEDMEPRPPVVTVMGHVDHGKTTLLDTIRRTSVADREAGGITQHIGAYQVQTKSGKRITFIDTPGHAAFTAMRARGAAVTDVVILVVAADDGVMPQTVEAIKHAKAAGVPIVVAVNKCDKPEANPDRVKQELLEHELVAESFGGDTIFVEVSAKTGTGIEELEEMVLLQADVLELKANPNRTADGIVVESNLDKGRGPVATVIVKHGTIKVGDILVAGSTWGRVRALLNDLGDRVEQAGPATPVEIIGLQGVPDAGEPFNVVADERKAREIAEYRDKKKRDAEQAAKAGSRTLESLLAGQTGDQKELAVVVKGDVQGSVEAITDALTKLGTDEVIVRAIHSGVGVITESDVMLATASNAIIIGFNVRASAQAREIAERDGVEIRYYSVIYNLIDDIKAAMSGLLSPALDEKVLGMAEVRETYHVSKVGTIAGCMVTEGLLRRNSKCRVLRDGVIIHDGELSSLKRFKDDAKEVQSGYECGLTLQNFNNLREGDQIECYEITERAVSLDELKAAADKRAAEKKVADKIAAEKAEAAEREAELASNS